ncbi:MAG TPA: BatA domain-containing protein, partial [Tahibacter sp.]|nr:BatA domain-containing protein [Tahibacter sp.]
MSFALLAPLGLAALAALVVPIVIHLVRRIELRTTEFAALRWIFERIRPRRRLRFERPWLLALRLALIAAIAMLLARPVLEATSRARRVFVVVAPGVDAGAARAAVSPVDAEWHWLAADFPTLETPLAPAPVPTASLLREIDARLPPDTSLVAVVPSDLGGLDGERPALSRAVEWHVVPGRSPDDAAAAAPDALKIAVRYAPASEPALAYLRAAIAALNTDSKARYELDAQPASAAVGDARALVVLGSDITPAVDAWIESGGLAIVDRRSDAGSPLWRDADGNVLARSERRGEGRLVSLAAALSPATFAPLLDADFPAR